MTPQEIFKLAQAIEGLDFNYSPQKNFLATPSFYFEMKVSPNLPADQTKKDSQPITNPYFQDKNGIHFIKKIKIFASGLITINTYDGLKKVSLPTLAQRNQIFNLIKNDIIKVAAHRHAGEKAQNWNNRLAESAYNIEMKELYRKIHQQMKITLSDLVQPKAQYTIIEGGCGQGALINLCIDELTDKKISAQYMAFDFSPENINYCLKNYDATKCHYFVDSLFNINNIILQSKNNKNINPGEKIILLLSGVLTRQVLNNTFECATALQSIYHAGIDYLIIGGGTALLFNKHMTNNIGFELISASQDLQDLNPIYLLKRNSERKLKIKNGNCLDLSLSPDPLLDLKSFSSSQYKQAVPIMLKLVTNEDEVMHSIRFKQRIEGENPDNPPAPKPF
jgi:hypothetical protein